MEYTYSTQFKVVWFYFSMFYYVLEFETVFAYDYYLIGSSILIVSFLLILGEDGRLIVLMVPYVQRN